MLSDADEKSTLILVLSVVVIILICGAFALDAFNRHSFHQGSLELITDPQSQLQHNN